MTQIDLFDSPFFAVMVRRYIDANAATWKEQTTRLMRFNTFEQIREFRDKVMERPRDYRDYAFIQLNTRQPSGKIELLEIILIVGAAR